MDLFGYHMIERLAGVADGPRIPVVNGSEARWALDASGRQWVRKREEDTGPQPLLAEAAAYLLGQQLGVPQPRCAVHFEERCGWSWMSERVPGVSHWERDARDLVVNLAEFGHLLAMDALTFNQDRHPLNILVQPLEDEAHLRVWGIDSGNAQIGWPGDYIRQGLDAPRPDPRTTGLPITALLPHALSAAEVASSIPPDVLAAIIAESCALARESEIAPLTEALIMRCRHARAIVSAYLSALGAVS